MTPAARLSAAIEVLTDIEERRRPATDALKDWGLAHRFAGSGDRAAIASLVYDALRHRASAGWIMDDATPRAALLGALPLVLAIGPGAELRRPLGVTIIGGLILSQILTLYTTPVVYLLMDRLSRKARRRPLSVTENPAQTSSSRST